MGWGEFAAAVGQIILWFLNWWKESHDKTKQEKADVIKQGVDAVLGTDNQKFLLALDNWKRFRVRNKGQ
jgi:hypothetical protein